MENAKCTTKKAVQAFQELDFSEDTCNINQYIRKIMQNNDISQIINMERQVISLVVYHMLQKLLAKDRNFKVANVPHYCT